MGHATRYDIIGDLHGHADALSGLLDRLGYRESGGVYRHAESVAVFVGDFIDRGPAIRETLAIVRAMVDAGSALTVMGNHEYNAICFNRTRPDEPHRWLRSRADRHLYQHLETIYQFRHHRGEWRDHLSWFFQLPLFLDLGLIRVVHASWYEPSLAVLRGYSDEGNRLTEPLLESGTRRGTPEFDAMQHVLKGVEVDLPGSSSFLDKDGNERREMRVRWWLNASGRNYREIAIPSRPEIHATPVAEQVSARIPGYRDATPVFIGHYWLSNDTPQVLAPRVACLDFSVAKGGYLAAYRWQGEEELTNDHFVVQE